jgi:hypothetical protein
LSGDIEVIDLTPTSPVELTRALATALRRMLDQPAITGKSLTAHSNDTTIVQTVVYPVRLDARERARLRVL